MLIPTLKVLGIIFSLFLTFIPSPKYNCNGDILTAIIRNNLNGDFKQIQDIEKVDKGAFVVINWRDENLMLPISFNSGEITFTDKKWLWSYQDKKNGLRSENPRFAHILNNGEIKEYSCDAIY
tara:strand:+ start:470 stop:838 length:369 start_codon:yes stop_codon:yes gene_type:complete